eukprot:GHVH01004407.1.p1 GENE.GHVH01004407.1~~GHVH01004407.1.p1  ORF type:complete len:217 (+),score=26.08 GHVH01004407.1:344-994(+)
MLKDFCLRNSIHPLSDHDDGREDNNASRPKDEELEVERDFVVEVTANRIYYDIKRNLRGGCDRRREMSPGRRIDSGLVRNTHNHKIEERFPTRHYSKAQLLQMVNEDAIGGHRGLTMYHLNLKKLTEKQMYHVKKAKPLEKLFQDSHRTLCDFIRSMLVTDCRLRPDAATLMNHPFLKMEIVERDELTLQLLLGDDLDHMRQDPGRRKLGNRTSCS